MKGKQKHIPGPGEIERVFKAPAKEVNAVTLKRFVSPYEFITGERHAKRLVN